MDSIKNSLVILATMGALALAAEATYARPPSEPNPTTETATSLEATVSAKDITDVCSLVRDPSNRIDDFELLSSLGFPAIPIYESKATIDGREYCLFLVEGTENDVFAYLEKRTQWIGPENLGIGMDEFRGFLDGSILEVELLKKGPDGSYDWIVGGSQGTPYEVVRMDLLRLMMGGLTPEECSETFTSGQIISNNEPGGQLPDDRNRWTTNMKEFAQEATRYLD